MRGLPFILVAALPFSTGCNLTKLISYNTFNEPLLAADRAHLNHRATKFAKEAWLEHLTAIPDNCPPEVYEIGFMHGYTDYLLEGGNGAPPTLPPTALRRKKYMDPEGQLEIRAYYTGFAVGSAAAKASGLRPLYFLIPISAPLPRADTPNYDTGREVEKTFPDETLPQPEKSKGGDSEKSGDTPSPRELPAPPAKTMFNGAVPEPIREPRSTAAEKPMGPEAPLPRDFTFPILGGPSAR